MRVLVHFFFTALIFSLLCWPLAFLILSPSLQNFHVVLPTKKMSPLFFISRSRSLSPFFSLSVAGLPLFLFFPVFLLLYVPNLWTWQLILAQYFSKHGYRNNFRFPVSSLLTL